MKKHAIFILCTILILVLSACNKTNIEERQGPGKEKSSGLTGVVQPTPVQTGIDGKASGENEKSDEDVKIPDLQEPLKSPESFLQNADYNLPSDKIYYTKKVVVLTYHHISSKPFSGITIKPERFESDIKMLKESNFNVISFRDMINAMQGKAKFPPNAVVITFDDGIGSFYKYAYPVLKKYNVPAVNFVITSRVEGYTPSNDDFNPLGPDQIREMYESRLVDIQSHSHNGHQYVIRDEKGSKGGYLAYKIYDKSTGTYETTESYDARVFDDLTKSIELIGEYTGNKPDTLCFPFGHYNAGLVSLGKEAGFKYFVTTAYGYNRENSKSILIRRIRSGDSKLTTEKLKINIINCGQGRPATQ